MNSNMKCLEEIFCSHDEIIKIDKSTYEFGFKWNMNSGIVLYPKNTISEYFHGLMNILFPEVNVVVFGERERERERAAQIAKEMPDALIVLCEMQSHLNKSILLDYANLVRILPFCWVNRVITARQIGEFLPVGTRKTKFFDYFRKTYLATEPGVKEKVRKAYSLFEDTLSQATFLSILKRYLLCSDTLIPISSREQYFENVFSLREDEVFIDCGGFIGDTLLEYNKIVNGIFKEYYIFEPDPHNFNNMEKNIKHLPDNILSKVKKYQKALGHTPSMISFDSIGGLESRVNENGNIKVEVVTLDDVLKNVMPTFMKLDLEGYEAFSLLGARETIKRSRPVISLCVYHYPFDLWELPLLINNFVSEYRFFLRAYNEMFDYVCYCVPEERLGTKENIFQS